MIEWNDFNKYEKMYDPYFVSQGEGDNMATQTVIAISKLVYKWFNDGDVYDNRYYLDGWWNDLSTYANWLYNNIKLTELENIEIITNENEYTEMLYNVCSQITPELLQELETKEKTGSIYTEEGPFEFVEYVEEDEYEDY